MPSLLRRVIVTPGERLSMSCIMYSHEVNPERLKEIVEVIRYR